MTGNNKFKAIPGENVGGGGKIGIIGGSVCWPQTTSAYDDIVISDKMYTYISTLILNSRDRHKKWCPKFTCLQNQA